MNPDVTHIPPSNTIINAKITKLQTSEGKKDTRSSIKTGLKQPSVLFSTQGIKLIQAQVSTLQGDKQSKQKKLPSPVASSLLPFLLKELHKSVKTESSFSGEKAVDPLEPKDDSPESKIQALNELIEDFSIEEDDDFMDLSRWIMNANNEMSIDD